MQQPTKHLWVMKVGNFLFSLLILILMLDPGNAILHLKDKVFVLFLGFNLLFLRPNFKLLPHITAVFSVLILGTIVAIVQNSPIDYDFLLASFKGIAPMILILWVHHYDALKLAIIPSVLTCLTIVVLYGFVVTNEAIEYALWLYSKEKEEIVMLTTRNLLGFKVFGMYYRSIVSIIPILFLLYFKLYNHSHSKKFITILVATIVTIAFLISGTRAMMLTPFFVFGVINYRKINELRKSKYFLYPLIALLAIAFLVLVALLAMQEGDESNAIKYGHLYSYAKLFNEHPEYLIWGEGAGTTFYTEGFNKVSPQTEWIYIELLRNYGLMSVVIIGVFAYPLWIFWKHRDDKFTKGFILIYFGFLLIAGTNPFLLNSQGMTVLWMVYSHALLLSSQNNIIKQIK